MNFNRLVATRISSFPTRFYCKSNVFHRYTTVATTASKEPEVKSPTHGSYHWNAERALSLITLPLMGTAVIYGSVPVVDIALGIVMPFHIHLGFDCMIQDYLPKRRSPILNTICTWLLRLGTILTLYGCYVINSRDVGLTALTARLWTGKVPVEDKKK